MWPLDLHLSALKFLISSLPTLYFWSLNLVHPYSWSSSLYNNFSWYQNLPLLSFRSPTLLNSSSWSRALLDLCSRCINRRHTSSLLVFQIFRSQTFCPTIANLPMSSTSPKRKLARCSPACPKIDAQKRFAASIYWFPSLLLCNRHYPARLPACTRFHGITQSIFGPERRSWQSKSEKKKQQRYLVINKYAATPKHSSEHKETSSRSCWCFFVFLLFQFSFLP